MFGQPPIVKKSSIPTHPIYKRFDWFTTRITRLTKVSHRIILELTRLEPNKPLQKKKKRITTQPHKNKRSHWVDLFNKKIDITLYLFPVYNTCTIH